MCFGAYYPSTFVRFTTALVSSRLDPRTDFNYPYAVADEVVRVLGLNATTSQPNVRACFEANQRPALTFENGTAVARTCSMTVNFTSVVVVNSVVTNFTFSFFVELVSGPQNFNTSALAQSLVGLVNGGALLNTVFVRSAVVLNFNPFAVQDEFVPWL